MDDEGERPGVTEGPGGASGGFWAHRFLTMLSLPTRPPGRVRSFSLQAGRISGDVTVQGEPETAVLSVDLLGPGWVSLWRRALRLAPGDPLPGPDDPRTIRLARTEGISPVPARHAVLARCSCGTSVPGAWCEHVTTLALTAAGHVSLDPSRLWILRGLGTAHLTAVGAGPQAVNAASAAGPAQARPVAAPAPQETASVARGGTAPSGREGPVVVAAPASLRRLPVHHVPAGPDDKGMRAGRGDPKPGPKPEAAPPPGPALSMADFWGKPFPRDWRGGEEDPLLRPWTEEPRALTRLGPLPTARGQAASAETVLDQYRANRDMCLGLLSPPPAARTPRPRAAGEGTETPPPAAGRRRGRPPRREGSQPGQDAVPSSP